MLFDLGYVLFWIGVFTAVRGNSRPLRWGVFVLFRTTLLVVCVTICVHQYFRETGAALDNDTIIEWFPKFNEIDPILFGGEVSFLIWVTLFLAFFYTILDSWLVVSGFEWWRGLPRSKRLGSRFWAL